MAFDPTKFGATFTNPAQSSGSFDPSKFGGTFSDPSKSSASGNGNGFLGTVDSAVRRAGSLMNDFSSGVNQGALSSMAGMGGIMEKGVNAVVNPALAAMGKKPAPDTSGFINNLTTPANAAQSVGKGAEQLAEIATPIPGAPEVGGLGLAGEAASKLGLAEKAGIVGKAALGGAAEFGAKSAVQSGGDPKATLTGAAIGAAGAPLEVGGNLLSGKLPKDFINSLIKPVKSELQYGKDAAKGVIDQGITANTLEGFSKKVSAGIEDNGKKIQNVVTTPAAKKIVMNVTDIVTKPFDDAIAAVKNSWDANSQALLDTIYGLRDKALTNQEEVGKLSKEEMTTLIKQGTVDPTKLNPRTLVSTGAKDLSKMDPEGVWNLKKVVGKASKWSGNPAQDDIINKLKVQIYHGLKTALEDAVPAVKKPSELYANLLSAQTAVDRRIAAKIGAPMIGNTTKVLVGSVGTLAGTILGGAQGGAEVLAAELVGGGLLKLGNTTAFKTRMAQAIDKFGPEIVPMVKDFMVMSNARKSRNSQNTTADQSQNTNQ